MQILKRTQLAFDDVGDLVGVVVEVIDDCTDEFGELETQDAYLIELIEDLTDLEVWEVVDLAVELIEQSGVAETFVSECIERWRYVEPEFCEDIVNALGDEL